jgi:hypothetical protein
VTTPTLTSQVAAVIDYLVTACEASALLGQNPTAPVQVFDGPQPPGVTQVFENVLWIGCDPSIPGTSVADASQDWPLLDHARTRDEDGTITCAAQHWSGDPSNQVHRDGAAAIVAGVELLLRGIPGDPGSPGDATMGGLVLWSGIDQFPVHAPRQAANGASWLIVFKIVYRARLTTGT